MARRRIKSVSSKAPGSVKQRHADYELQPFRREHAALVASWVRDDDELFWLAPQTSPPVTPDKVIGWTAQRGRPMLFRPSPGPGPIGYAELNDMPGQSGELWIGHFILDPARRGRGLGGEMLRLLLAQAFGPLGAFRVALIVFPDNHPAIRCYESGGLVSARRQPKRFVSRPGVHEMIEMAIDRNRYQARVREAAG